jgi:hypothetical protein
MENREGEEQARQRRLIMPLLELSEAPRLETGDNMLGLVVGERLRAYKPRTLGNVQNEQQDDHNPAAAADGLGHTFSRAPGEQFSMYLR